MFILNNRAMHTTLVDLLANPTITHKSIIKRIVSHHCGRNPSECIIHQDDPISAEVVTQILADYNDFCNKNKPIEYILGRCEFLRRKFIVTPATLIPRAETEYMIIVVRDWIMANIKKNGTDQLWLYDIGTGSGVLGVSIDCETNHQALCVIMTDIDEKCLDVAQKNIATLIPKDKHSRFHLKQADLCNFLADNNFYHTIVHQHMNEISEKNIIHVFISNLPYIPDQTFFGSDELSVREREPHHAFLGGNDGLDLYRHQFRQRNERKTINHVKTIMFCEMMTWQAEILAREYPHLTQKIHKTFHANIIILSVK